MGGDFTEDNTEGKQLSSKKVLLIQMLKFFVVGFLSFAIDAGILTALVHFAHMNATLAATISFTISLVFNYLVSMKYVFAHRDDMARWMEMTIFLISSLIGLLINDLIIWIFTSLFLPAGTQQTESFKYLIYTWIGKIIATVIVSVWNFGIRKWLLDAPSETHKVGKTATRLGEFSLRHGPQSKK